MRGEIISSTKNPTLKHVRKLISGAKYRNEQGLAVAEGVHLVESILKSELLIETVVCSQAATDNEEVDAIISRLDLGRIKLLVVRDSMLEALTDIHPKNGILAVFAVPRVSRPAELNETALLLEDIQDPGNVGTILRTALAAGVKSIFLSPSSASAWSPKCLRAGMGAQFGLTIYEQVDLLSLTRQTNLPVFATALDRDSLDLYEADLAKEVVWVFGNEGQGVSRELLAACTATVRIPQEASSIESLNVAAAAAVCLYEQLRQRRVLQ